MKYTITTTFETEIETDDTLEQVQENPTEYAELGEPSTEVTELK